MWINKNIWECFNKNRNLTTWLYIWNHFDHEYKHIFFNHKDRKLSLLFKQNLQFSQYSSPHKSFSALNAAVLKYFSSLI